ncbi:amidase [Leifsonia sp. NPDC056665]|uniref:amidase n=1 Tax=Leifsonia sp. NPDC056665 TaxID=3345901 RepID=UPI0036CD87D9
MNLGNGRDAAPGQAAAIARSVRTGRRTAVSVIEEAVELIERVDPYLNAVIASDHARALSAARSIDTRIRAGEDVGPFAGVPFTVKDVIATEGLPTTCGSRAVTGTRDDEDATAVARMRAAGAILIGKTNCPEFAFSVLTDNDRFGPTINPIEIQSPATGPQQLVAGGSSGGEAVAIAAGFSVVGLGTDFGGSVRWPAQCTGVLGLRPTVGRVPATGQLPGVGGGPWPPNPRTLQGRLQVIGPMGRSVDDVEATLRVVAGPDAFDSTAVPALLGDSAAIDLRTVECRWETSIGELAVDAEVAVAVEYAAELLRSAGVRASRGLPPAMDHAHSIYSRLRDAEPLTELRNAIAGREGSVTRHIAEVLEAGMSVSEDELTRLWARRDLLRADLLGWLRGERILALPVSTVAPFASAAGLPFRGGRRLSEPEVVAPCRLVSLFGLPSLSVPVMTSATGVPISVQLVGPPFREDLVLAAARAVH